MKPKVLIVGSGHTPTGRCRALLKQVLLAGVDASYHNIDAKIIGNKVHQALIDGDLLGQINLDLSELELRIGNAPICRNSHADIIHFYNGHSAQQPPDKRKGPKGPRGKWGKLK